jgi:hypothetical protein
MQDTSINLSKEFEDPNSLKDNYLLNKILQPKFYMINSIGELFLYLSIEGWLLGLARYWLTGIFVLIVYLLVKKSVYKKVTFELKQDSIECCESFWGQKRKTIKYRDIKQIELKQDILQRYYNTGVIAITTNAAIQDAGIDINDIKEYREVYEFILEKTKHNA